MCKNLLVLYWKVFSQFNKYTISYSKSARNLLYGVLSQIQTILNLTEKY